MRSTSLPLMLGLLLLTCGPVFGQGSDVPWISDPYQARHLAQQQQRLILMHFFTDWCAPCRKLDRDVFPRAEVVRAICGNYIAVKINAEKFQDIARQYQVDRFPTDVITDPSGRELFRTVTPQDPSRYCMLLDKVAADNRAGPPNYAVAGRPPAPPVGYAAAPGASGRPGPAYPVDGAAGVAGGAPPGSPGYYQAGYQEPLAGGAYPPRSGPSAWPPPQTAQPPAGNEFASRAPYGAGDPGRDYRSSVGEPRPQMTTNPYATAAWPGVAPNGPTAGYDAQAGSAPAPRGAFVENQYLQRSAEPAPRSEPAGRYGAGESLLTSAPGAAADRLPAVALDGYCPVTLSEEERWQKGDPQWGAIHRGQTFLFATHQHQQKFLADPDRYSPVLSGYDPVRYLERGEVLAGKRRHGMWFRGKIYLFADEAGLDRFSQSAEYYAQKAHEAMMAGGR